MEEQTFVTNREDAEIFFTGHAIQGLLSGNSILGRMPYELAKQAVKIGKTVASEMFPEPMNESQD